MIVIINEYEEEIIGRVYSYEDNNKLLILSKSYYYDFIEEIDKDLYEARKEEVFIGVNVYNV